MGKHVGIDFPKLYAEVLREFLYEALLNGYSSESQTNDDDSDDGSTVIKFSKGEWEYIDTYYGGEPYSGITIIKFQGITCWTMVYWGRITLGFDKQTVYDCLMPALMNVDKMNPFRGPKLFEADNGLRYENIYHGDIIKFHGQESVKNENNDWMFWTCYHGGCVNLE